MCPVDPMRPACMHSPFLTLFRAGLSSDSELDTSPKLPDSSAWGFRRLSSLFLPSPGLLRSGPEAPLEGRVDLVSPFSSLCSWRISASLSGSMSPMPHVSLTAALAPSTSALNPHVMHGAQESHLRCH